MRLPRANRNGQEPQRRNSAGCVFGFEELRSRGSGSDPAVGEALWNKGGVEGPGFGEQSDYYKAIAKMTAGRNARRPGITVASISGRAGRWSKLWRLAIHAWRVGPFGMLNDEETIVVANSSPVDKQALEIILENRLGAEADTHRILYRPSHGILKALAGACSSRSAISTF